MSERLQAIRGMNDILPAEMPYWHYLENVLRNLAKTYSYSEIRTPVLEPTALFKRSIGEVTDIVEKEMYTFDDRNNDSLTMRPEGTAGVVRSGIEKGLFYNQVQRLWYMGPIFRHERPQQGRYRQFYQFGIEAVGMEGAEIDAEMIFINARLWRILGLQDQISLQLNSLGSQQSRQQYREVLIEYFSDHRSKLDNDSQRRIVSNPLRILDSKNPDMQELISHAPKLTDYLDEKSAAHFERLQQILTDAEIKFEVNPCLVRGLDYYTNTVFEWVTSSLGAQGTVSAGGRYDGLIEQLGGHATPAVGFAMGLERVIELLRLKKDAADLQITPQVFMMMMGQDALALGMVLAEHLRSELPDLRLVTNLTTGGFKSQFKKADKSGSEIALILGEQELADNTISIKFLREDKPQQTLVRSQLKDFLVSQFS